jgi:glyoxylase I family protein
MNIDQVANPINITQVDHVVLRVNDISKMIDWYCEVLGCRLERGPGEIGLAQLRAGSSLIDLVDAQGPLGKKGGAAPDGKANNMDHLCLRVYPWDSEAVLAQLRHHGVTVDDVADRYGASGMGPSIYLEDPEGNMLELKGS